MSTGSKRPSVIEIAKLAGVSPSTVSNTLNGKGRSSEATKKKVLEICKKHGYTPNSAARNLRLKKTETIGVMFYPTCAQLFRNVFYGEVMESLEKHLEIAGYDVLLAGYSNVIHGDDDTPRFIRRGKVDGIVLLGDYPDKIIKEIQSNNLPMLLLDSDVPDLNIDSITTNGSQASIDIVQDLYGKGHRNIAYLAYDHKNYNTEQRISGYSQGLTKAGLTHDDKLVIRTEHETCLDSIRPFLESDDPITAVLCENDHLASRLVRELQSNGYKVPEKVSVFGFDDDSFSADSKPAISTVAVDRAEIGKMGAYMILKRIERPTANKSSISLSTSLIHRKSVREL